MNNFRLQGKHPLPYRVKSILSLLAITAILIAACAPGTFPMIQTPTPAVTPQAATCQGIQLDAPCDPRPFFESYAQNGQFEEFAWDLFLYMNWPAQAGMRGVPDPTKSLMDREKSTWETWKDLRETFRITGEVPLAWDAPQPSPNTGFFSMDRVPQISSVRHWITDTINTPPRAALLGLRMNKPVFDYIVEHKLYNIDGQLAFFNDPDAPTIDFPRDSIEIKSTWIFLNQNVCNEADCPFHVANLTIGGAQRPVGLTGLHIMSKVQEDWFWATFEHVGNGTNTNAPQTLPPVARAQEVNEKMHEQLAGTVWENYILRGAQWDFVDQQGNSTLVSNTQIETQFQRSSSCITCHSLASRGGEQEGFLSFFQATAGGVEGWVGEAPWELYCKDGASIVRDGGDEPVGELFCEKYNREALYLSTDYVWVLRLAFRASE